MKSVSTGSHDAYALIPIALLAAALAIGVFIAASRPALLAIGILGVISLVIALAGDLPDAKASGLTHNYVLASSSPSTGLYLETLGAIILLLTCGLGFLLLGPPAHRRPEARKPGPPRSDMSAS